MPTCSLPIGFYDRSSALSFSLSPSLLQMCSIHKRAISLLATRVHPYVSLMYFLLLSFSWSAIFCDFTTRQAVSKSLSPHSTRAIGHQCLLPTRYVHRLGYIHRVYTTNQDFNDGTSVILHWMRLKTKQIILTIRSHRDKYHRERSITCMTLGGFLSNSRDDRHLRCWTGSPKYG